MNEMLKPNAEQIVFDCGLFALCSNIIAYPDFFTNGSDDLICDLRLEQFLREQFN